jgi:hypothetical protein
MAGTESSPKIEAESKPRVAIGSQAPFNHRFFQTIFPERLQAICQGHSEEVPVVLLQLADDRELDLCHIELLAPQWMAAAVFRNSVTCEDMDTVFVPYEMITRVTLSHRNAKERHLGFQSDRPIPEVLRGSEGRPAGHADPAALRKG